MYIYIHIPFCASKCIYCDFFVVLEKYGGQAAYVDAVIREIHARLKAAPSVSPIQTLYVGGGTPSLLSGEDYARIIGALRQHTDFAPDAEITLEANPQTMRDTPQAYLAAGFNRLSIGVQSLNDDELKKLSRRHNASEAMTFVRDMHAAGFKNLSIDLMYGLPLQTIESWEQTLAQACGLPIQHISMYGLKVEENTPLDRLVGLPGGTYALPEDDVNVEMYFKALDTLESQGFAQYEFSNLARPGYESRHNLNYWDNGDYWAFGASAHGYVADYRYENIRDLKTYLDNPLAGESALCPPTEKLENAIIFGLRKREGIDIAALDQAFDIDFRQRYQAPLSRFIMQDLLILEHGRLRLTKSAIPVSNSVLMEFLG